MSDLALRIEGVTDTFDYSAQVYAFGVRNVLENATHDLRWRQLLDRSEVMVRAMYRRMGPFAICCRPPLTRAFTAATPN